MILNSWRTGQSILSSSWPRPTLHRFGFDAYLRPCCSLMHEAALPPALMTATLPDTDTALKAEESNTLEIMRPPPPQLWAWHSSGGRIIWVITIGTRNQSECEKYYGQLLTFVFLGASVGLWWFSGKSHKQEFNQWKVTLTCYLCQWI